jgi:pSer/pThr/pTyr-binding forkhead associated (FHA) protein
MPTCPNCGADQPDGAIFCDECGVELTSVTPTEAPPPVVVPAQTISSDIQMTCPVCGAPAEPGEAFCNNCGAALGPVTTAVPPQAAAPAPPSPAATPAPAPAAALRCSRCGDPLEPGSNFCDQCGFRVDGAVPAAPQPETPSAPPYIPTSPPATELPASATIPATPPAQPPTSIPGTPIGYPPGTPTQIVLVVQSTNATLPFPSGKTEFIIGREDPVSGIFPDIDLTDHGADEGGISRQHARVFFQGNRTFVEDLESTNYTYVNRHRLTPGQPHPLNSGDELRLGRVKLNFYLR